MEIAIVAALLGLIPATIAHKKGRRFAPWWLYGFLLFIVALPHALLLKPRPTPGSAGNAGVTSPPRSPGPPRRPARG